MPPTVSGRDPVAFLVYRKTIQNEIVPAWQPRLALRRYVLRLATAERPVFLRHLDQIDENILPAQLQGFMQAVGDSFIEALLHLNRTAAAQRNLYKDAVVGPVNAEVVPVKQQFSLGMFRDDLEAVVLRDG